MSDDPCPHHCQTNIGASQWRCEECGEVISACPHCCCTYTTECCYCDGSRTPLEDSVALHSLHRVVRELTEFQVGDRVSVEGVVTQLWPDAKPKPMALVSMDRESYDIPADYWIQDQALTLIERPKRKLRVGSVWERWGVHWAVGTDQDGDQHLVRLSDGARVEIDLITPSEWREVPVEELEREAQE